MRENLQVTTRRGPYKVGLERRADILAVALREFANAGFEAASLRAIAAKAKISHSGLLYHFDSKDDLLLAVLAAGESEDRELTASFAGSADIDALQTALLALFERHLADPSWVRLWVSLKLNAGADVDHVAHRYVTRRLHAWTAELASVLREAQQHGRVRAELDCHSAAVGLLALHEGLLIQSVAAGTADIKSPLIRALDQIRA